MPTTDTRHSRKSVSNGGLHGLTSILYANATDRANDVRSAGYLDPFVTDDISRIARQEDDDSLWVLLSIGPPVWGSAVATGEANTASTLGGDEPLTAAKVGVDLRFKGLTAGAGVQLASGSVAVIISSPFGADYQIAAEEALSTTTSATYQTKTTLITPVLTGDYLITWTARIRQTSPANRVAARLFDVTNGAELGLEAEEEPKDGNNRILVGSFVPVTFADESRQIEIQYRRVTGGGTAGIDGARITIWRVA